MICIWLDHCLKSSFQKPFFCLFHLCVVCPFELTHFAANLQCGASIAPAVVSILSDVHILYGSECVCVCLSAPVAWFTNNNAICHFYYPIRNNRRNNNETSEHHSQNHYYCAPINIFRLALILCERSLSLSLSLIHVHQQWARFCLHLILLAHARSAL